MYRFIGIDPVPRTWRQISTGIAREYIQPHLLEEGRTTSSDIASKRSSTVSRIHYARSGDDIPRLTTDSICENRATCQAWHDVLGVGKNSPPLPVRLQLGSSLPDLQASVKLAVQEALVSINLQSILQSQTLATLPDVDRPSPVTSEGQALAALAPVKSQSPVPEPTSSTQDTSVRSHLSTPYASSLSMPSSDFNMADEIDIIPLSFAPRVYGKRKRVVKTYSDDHDDDPAAVSPSQQSPSPSLSDFIVNTSQESPLSQLPSSEPRDQRSYKRAKNVGTVLAPDSSPPSSSPVIPPSEEDWGDFALAGLRKLFGNPSAQFKSNEQRMLVMHVLSCSADIFGILATGGGKSAIWQVSGILQPHIGGVVVVPFVLPNADQVTSNIEKGIPTWKYRSTEECPKDTVHIFCQPENYVSKEFQM